MWSEEKRRRMQRGISTINNSQSLPNKRRCFLLTCVIKRTFGRVASLLHCFSEYLRERKVNAFHGVAEISFWLFRFRFPFWIDPWDPFEKSPSPVWSGVAIFSRWHWTWARPISCFLVSRTKKPETLEFIHSKSCNSPRLLLSLDFYWASCFLDSGATRHPYFQVLCLHVAFHEFCNPLICQKN